MLAHLERALVVGWSMLVHCGDLIVLSLWIDACFDSVDSNLKSFEVGWFPFACHTGADSCGGWQGLQFLQQQKLVEGFKGRDEIEGFLLQLHYFGNLRTLGF